MDELTFRRYERYATFLVLCARNYLGRGGGRRRGRPRHSQANVGCARAHRRVRQNRPHLPRRPPKNVVVWTTTFLKLTGHGLGRYSYRRPLIAMRDPLLDPRTLADRARGIPIGPDYPTLDDDELRRLVDHYVAAAKIAYQAGFQFVDLKQCHRYLLNELLAARTRPGPYGGSFENRTRLARDVILAIRAEVPNLLLVSRLNAFDGVPYRKAGDRPQGEPTPWRTPVDCVWGTRADNPLEPDLTEPKRWIAEMQKLGVSCINISAGNPYASPHLLRPFEYPPPDGWRACSKTPGYPLTAGRSAISKSPHELQKAAAPTMPMVEVVRLQLLAGIPPASGCRQLTRRQHHLRRRWPGVAVATRFCQTGSGKR